MAGVTAGGGEEVGEALAGREAGGRQAERVFSVFSRAWVTSSGDKNMGALPVAIDAARLAPACDRKMKAPLPCFKDCDYVFTYSPFWVDSRANNTVRVACRTTAGHSNMPVKPPARPR